MFDTPWLMPLDELDKPLKITAKDGRTIAVFSVDATAEEARCLVGAPMMFNAIAKLLGGEPVVLPALVEELRAALFAANSEPSRGTLVDVSR